MDRLRTDFIKILVFLSIIFINSCAITPPKHRIAIDRMQESMSEGIRDDIKIAQTKKMVHVPRSVSDSLVPTLDSNLPHAGQISPRRFDVIADKMPTKVFFMGLVDGTPYNMVVDPSIEGTVSLNLKNVTIIEAMDAVKDMYGYQYHRTSYGFEVLPQEIQTEIFAVNYLNVKRTGESSTSLTTGQVTDVGSSGTGGSNSNGNVPVLPTGSTPSTSGSNVNTTSEMNFWKDVESTLKAMVNPEKGRSVVVNPQAGIVIVHAFRSELNQIARYIDRIQSNMQRQVVIEAKVLEVTLDDSFQAGIDWSLLGDPKTGDALLSQKGNGVIVDGGFQAPNIKAFESMFTITMKGSFRNLIRLLETQGNVQVLSSPRISTLNNQKAVINVGQDEFFVTGVSTQNNVSNNQGGGTTTTPTQNVTLTPFFSGVTLDVTPQISKNGIIILHIHPTVSKVTEQQKNITLGSTGLTPNTLTLPLALSTIRESDNIVRATDGQVVVIGGLMSSVMSEGISGTPWLAKLPGIGPFFRRTSQISTKTELVILLRPVVLNNCKITESLKRAHRDISNDKRDFHAGGRPDIFGNEGEVTDT